MHTEYNEKVGEFYKLVSKPLADLAELNINTIGKLTKNQEILEAVAQAKKPEEFFNAQIKIAQTAATEGIKYIQQACEIWLDALSQTGEVVNNNLRETSRKTNEAARQSKL